MIPFTKMHGLGNDFVMLDAFRSPALARRDAVDRLAIAMCRRRAGVGADGLILLAPDHDDADVAMGIWNADGSDGVICGNGLRCAARLLTDRGHMPGPAMCIRTGAGVRGARVAIAEGRFHGAEIDMGTPVVDVDRLPVEQRRLGRAGDGRFEVGVRSGVFVGVGNPHLVVVADDLDAVDLEREGPSLERHAAFPQRMNIQFVRVETPTRLIVRTWERGAGATSACGTGACAALVGCAVLGLAERDAAVSLPGGELRVRWSEADGRVHQAGPAEYAFEGLWPADDESP